MSKVNNGTVLCQIEPDGCLNGIYTNEIEDSVIYNEIAAYKTKCPQLGEGVPRNQRVALNI